MVGRLPGQGAVMDLRIHHIPMRRMHHPVEREQWSARREAAARDNHVPMRGQPPVAADGPYPLIAITQHHRRKTRSAAGFAQMRKLAFSLQA